MRTAPSSNARLAAAQGRACHATITVALCASACLILSTTRSQTLATLVHWRIHAARRPAPRLSLGHTATPLHLCSLPPRHCEAMCRRRSSTQVRRTWLFRPAPSVGMVDTLLVPEQTDRLCISQARPRARHAGWKRAFVRGTGRCYSHRGPTKEARYTSSPCSTRPYPCSRVDVHVSACKCGHMPGDTRAQESAALHSTSRRRFYSGRGCAIPKEARISPHNAQALISQSRSAQPALFRSCALMTRARLQKISF